MPESLTTSPLRLLADAGSRFGAAAAEEALVRLEAVLSSASGITALLDCELGHALLYLLHVHAAGWNEEQRAKSGVAAVCCLSRLVAAADDATPHLSVCSTLATSRSWLQDVVNVLFDARANEVGDLTTAALACLSSRDFNAAQLRRLALLVNIGAAALGAKGSFPAKKEAVTRGDRAARVVRRLILQHRDGRERTAALVVAVAHQRSRNAMPFLDALCSPHKDSTAEDVAEAAAVCVLIDAVPAPAPDSDSDTPGEALNDHNERALFWHASTAAAAQTADAEATADALDGLAFGPDAKSQSRSVRITAARCLLAARAAAAERAEAKTAAGRAVRAESARTSALAADLLQQLVDSERPPGSRIESDAASSSSDDDGDGDARAGGGGGGGLAGVVGLCARDVRMVASRGFAVASTARAPPPHTIAPFAHTFGLHFTSGFPEMLVACDVLPPGIAALLASSPSADDAQYDPLLVLAREVARGAAAAALAASDRSGHAGGDALAAEWARGGGAIREAAAAVPRAWDALGGGVLPADVASAAAGLAYVFRPMDVERDLTRRRRASGFDLAAKPRLCYLHACLSASWAQRAYEAAAAAAAASGGRRRRREPSGNPPLHSLPVLICDLGVSMVATAEGRRVVAALAELAARRGTTSDPDNLACAACATCVTARAVGAKCGLPSCEATRAADAGAKKLMRCSACVRVAYCCHEHSVADWPRHKTECMAARN